LFIRPSRALPARALREPASRRNERLALPCARPLLERAQRPSPELLSWPSQRLRLPPSWRPLSWLEPRRGALPPPYARRPSAGRDPAWTEADSRPFPSRPRPGEHAPER